MIARGQKKKRTLGPIDTNEKTVTLLENHRKLGTGRYYPTTGRTNMLGQNHCKSAQIVQY